MPCSRWRRVATCVALAVLLTSCTHPESIEENQHGTAVRPAAEWTEISIDNGALPDEPIWTVRAGLDNLNGLPALFAGSVARPGQPNRAVVWDPASLKSGTPVHLDVDTGESWAGGLTVVGDDTYVVGWTWQDGQQTSFVQRSSDRRKWEPVPIPDALLDRDIYLHTVVDNGSGTPIAIGSSLKEVVAVDLATGAIHELPSGEHLTSYDVGGAATLDDAVVVLVTARNESAGDIVVPYRSEDGGRTWTASEQIPGVEDSISGLVASGSGLVATGAHLVGDARRAAAWSSADGRRWKREKVPSSAVAGWDTSLGAPAADDAGIYSAVADNNRLDSHILRRNNSGRWEPFGPPADSWRHPGTPAVLARDGDSLLVARTEDGRMQVGRQTRSARRWRFRVTRSTASIAPVSSWTSVRVDGNTIQAVGSHSVMEVRQGNDWSRTRRLTAYSVTDGILLGASLMPRAASGLSDLSAATGPDGTQVVIGQKRVSYERFDLVGWRKRPGGAWEAVTGLSSPRVLFLASVAYVGDRWVITGHDAANTWGGHGYGAVWTSADGRRWKRERGPFDVDRHRDSWTHHVCGLPDGDILAVGGIQDPRSSSRPLAFRWDGTNWSRASVTGLGGDVVSLTSCTTTGDVTLVEGWELTQQFWRTTDARTFTRLDIGEEGDHVGDVVSVPGGFAAPGTVADKSRLQPVVWLSPDGMDWTPVPIPVPRSMSPSQATLWGDRLVVTLTSTSGPGVYVLENLADFLSATRS